MHGQVLGRIDEDDHVEAVVELALLVEQRYLDHHDLVVGWGYVVGEGFAVG